MARMPDAAKREQWRQSLLEFDRRDWNIASSAAASVSRTPGFITKARLRNRSREQASWKRNLNRESSDRKKVTAHRIAPKYTSPCPAAPSVHFIARESACDDAAAARIRLQPILELHLANGKRLPVNYWESEGIRTVTAVLSEVVSACRGAGRPKGCTGIDAARPANDAAP